MNNKNRAEELANKRKSILEPGPNFPDAFKELDLLELAASELKKAQHALKESEEKYRMLFTNVPLGIIHFDSDKIISGFNENFAKLTDIPETKLIGTKLLDILDFHMVSAIENSLAGSIGHYEGEFQTKNSGMITPVRVNFAPIKLEDGKIVGGVGIFEDISERKQIERIFFHDILNTTGSMNSVLDLIEGESISDEERKDLFLVLSNLTKRIINEILTHRHLVSNEKTSIKPNITTISSLGLISKLFDAFIHSEQLGSKKIKIDSQSTDDEFESDETLIGRVLGNMIKNAVEASSEEAIILIKSFKDNGMISFSVANSSFIPEEIQSQLFTRTVSTKGAGRGLGIYSMKLLTEKYLGGTLSFYSDREKGTTFTVSYPVIYPFGKESA
ncbi:MAG: PAS domain S-box protein [Melioribacteraceae bacterium]|jgi:PAS domain S-box-containing protein|nr:PAS domain S-box protein [Melioribacteraceae bacterium]